MVKKNKSIGRVARTGTKSELDYVHQLQDIIIQTSIFGWKEKGDLNLRCRFCGKSKDFKPYQVFYDSIPQYWRCCKLTADEKAYLKISGKHRLIISLVKREYVKTGKGYIEQVTYHEIKDEVYNPGGKFSP